MVLPQAMAWVQYWFCVLSLKFCGKSKKICGDISQLSPAFCMYGYSSSMNSGKIVADGWTDRGSIRGPRGPKKRKKQKDRKREKEKRPPPPSRSSLQFRGKQQKWKSLQCNWKNCNSKKSLTSSREGGKLRLYKVKHEPVERNRIQEIKIFDKYLHFAFLDPFIF